MHDLTIQGFISPITLASVVNFYTTWLTGQKMITHIQELAEQEQGEEKPMTAILDEIRRDLFAEDGPTLRGERLEAALGKDKELEFGKVALGEILLSLALDDQTRAVTDAFMSIMEPIAERVQDAPEEVVDAYEKPWKKYFPDHDFDAEGLQSFYALCQMITAVPVPTPEQRRKRKTEEGGGTLVDVLRSIAESIGAVLNDGDNEVNGNRGGEDYNEDKYTLSLIHISEPTRPY